MCRLNQDNPSASVFVDESGWTAKHRFLAVGALKVRDPARFEAILRDYRRQAGFTGPLRWANLSGASQAEVVLARRSLAMVCTDPECDFACVVLDRDTVDVASSYETEWVAYNRLASRAIAEALVDPEIAFVLADRFTSPSGHATERPIVQTVNNRMDRLALVGMQHVSSKDVVGLQLADLVLGAIVHQVRETNNPTGEEGIRMQLSRQVMQDHYGLNQYLPQGRGHLELNHLSITVLPLEPRTRGSRGGRRRANR